MKTYRVVYKPTGELVLDAAARLRRERARRLRHGGYTTLLMNEVGFPVLSRVLSDNLRMLREQRERFAS